MLTVWAITLITAMEVAVVLRFLLFLNAKAKCSAVFNNYY